MSQLQENSSTTEKPPELELQSREMVERGWTGLHRHRERDRLLAQLVERDKEIAQLWTENIQKDQQIEKLLAEHFRLKAEIDRLMKQVVARYVMHRSGS